VFVCDVCAYSFSKHQNLKSHRITRDGIRPFICPICSQAFSRQHDLKR
jgi:uncharacterized C2H2 Zn-finger protein